MMQKIKNWMLPVAMVVGSLFYRQLIHLAFLMPWLIFFMLLFTFTRIPPREVRFHRLHLWLLSVQVVGCLAVYLLLYPYDPVVAEAVLICVLAPTATAAAVITGLLGGSVGFLTSYILLSNIAVSVAGPVIFSFVGSNQELLFWASVWNIGKEVFPMLILPLICAWLIRWLAPRTIGWFLRMNQVPLYLWAVSLTIVTGRTVYFLVNQQTNDYTTEYLIAGITLVVCALQFLIGRKIGRRYGDPVSGGQGLGQKNTVLAIWLSHLYLNPIASVGPAAYILWQNIVNSYQLWRKNRRR